MKKMLLAAVLAIAATITGQKASAQFAYNFTKLNQPYAALPAFTSVANGSLWTSDSVFTLPIGFTFRMSGTTTDKIYLLGGNFITTNKQAVIQNGFVLLGTGLMDRGVNWMTARSDIRYLTSGVAGSRIFKMEIYNAGFEDEYQNNGEQKDSISLQLWLFEGTNVVEIHYGSSMVSNFNDYFGPVMMAGYLKNLNTLTGDLEQFYVAKGTPATPTLDSTTSYSNPKGLTSVPGSGIVFRFTPKSNSTTGIAQVAPGTLAQIFPTQCSSILHIEHSNAHPIQYAIISMAGQVVSTGTIAAGRTTIDLSGITAGTYTVRLQDEAATTYEAQKIIKL